MDRSFKSLTRFWRLLGMAFAGLVFAAGSGCVNLESSTASNAPEPPPLPVNEVMMYWEPSIRFAQDTTSSGTLMPGLAGRVYLINDDLKRMVDAQGSIHVAIRDTSPGAPTGQYAVKCEFKELDLKRLKRKDMLGDGYTLFVPWETFRPEIKHVEVQVCYTPKGGAPHYSSPMALPLRGDTHFQIERRDRVVGPAVPR